MEQSKKQQRAMEILERLKKQYPTAGLVLNYTTPIQLMVAVILSAQATDEQVNKTTESLFKKYKTVQDFATVDPKNFETQVSSVSFYKNKAKYILRSAHIIQKKYNGEIPDDINALVKLPGIGRKTANVLLWHLYGKSQGIVVDTHVKRVAQNLALTNNTDPEKIEKDLMSLYPQKDWGMIGHYFQAYGRMAMPARGKPKHEDCLQGFY